MMPFEPDPKLAELYLRRMAVRWFLVFLFSLPAGLLLLHGLEVIDLTTWIR